ncbi:MAG: hypothetical protein HYX44_02865 [Aquabacterium sp.]|nr:hypothetical protein [Aquabacterium sp.]
MTKLAIPFAMLGGLIAAQPVCAQTEVLPMSVQARFDPAHLEGGEPLGLVTTSLLFESEPGLWLGGGGGGGAPVGGGLMLVPSASLLYDWGSVQTGLSVSRVNMPSGRIGTQLGRALSLL